VADNWLIDSQVQLSTHRKNRSFGAPRWRQTAEFVYVAPTKLLFGASLGFCLRITLARSISKALIREYRRSKAFRSLPLTSYHGSVGNKI